MPTDTPVPATRESAAPALPWRDASMDDAPVYLDGDDANVWAMGYNAAREAFLKDRSALLDLAMSNLPPGAPARFEDDE